MTDFVSRCVSFRQKDEKISKPKIKRANSCKALKLSFEIPTPEISKKMSYKIVCKHLTIPSASGIKVSGCDECNSASVDKKVVAAPPVESMPKNKQRRSARPLRRLKAIDE
jgi:hypothetical protein